MAFGDYGEGITGVIRYQFDPSGAQQAQRTLQDLQVQGEQTGRQFEYSMLLVILLVSSGVFVG